MEARDELRSDRLSAGVFGEQFALPETVARLRAVRREQQDGRWVPLAAADPANPLGTVVNGPRLPRTASARLLRRGP